MKIAVATKNQNKVKELNELMNIKNAEFLSLKDLGFDGEIEENGASFEENALIKARFVCKKYSLPAISDDSGLCVDVLGGEPGIYSARYASENGENSDDKANIEKLLYKLRGIKDNEKTARFVCAMAYCAPDGTEFTVKGLCEGVICGECRGESGFGYDPIFFSTQLLKTFGEATDEEKNSVSHRAHAAALMSEKLREILK